MVSDSIQKCLCIINIQTTYLLKRKSISISNFIGYIQMKFTEFIIKILMLFLVFLLESSKKIIVLFLLKIFLLLFILNLQ